MQSFSDNLTNLGQKINDRKLEQEAESIFRTVFCAGKVNIARQSQLSFEQVVSKIKTSDN